MGQPNDLVTPDWLKASDICFEIKDASNKIEILQSPNEFYLRMLEEIGKANDRVFWSSLYFGNGRLEKDLIRTLLHRLERKESLYFCGIFDYCRGLRGGQSSNTAGMFLPVLGAFPHRSTVYLFRSPFFRGLKSFIPQRWNEIFSVHHMKLYVFDSTVILSGANLSDSYFTNRQDRYIVIRDVPALADFCCDVIKALGSVSFRIRADGSLAATNPSLVDPIDSYNVQRHGHSLLRSLLRRYAKTQNAAGNCDTMIYPFLQSAPLNIRDEENITEMMLRNLQKSDSLFLSTSYFNLTKNYQNLLLRNCPSEQVKLFISSPHSNGFSGASGFSRFVPHGYIYFSRKFNDQIVRTKQEGRIELYEYEREGWTFHSKGVWLTSEKSPDKLPYASFLGSTNFSFRSVNRDQEAQFILLTSNNAVRQRLKREVDDLISWCSRLNRIVFARPDHEIAKWVPLAGKIARYFF